MFSDTIIREYDRDIYRIRLWCAEPYPLGIEDVYLQYKANDMLAKWVGRKTEYIYVGAVVTKRILP